MALGCVTAAWMNGVSVSNGQLVRLLPLKSGPSRVSIDGGVLTFRATSFVLVVTATDLAGNTITVSATPVFGRDNDHGDQDDGNNR